MSVLTQIAAIVREAGGLCGTMLQHNCAEQARQLRGGTMRMLFWMVFLKLGFLLIAAGLGFVIWGVYMALAAALSATAAALITGGGVLLIGAVVLVIVKCIV